MCSVKHCSSPHTVTSFSNSRHVAGTLVRSRGFTLLIQLHHNDCYVVRRSELDSNVCQSLAGLLSIHHIAHNRWGVGGAWRTGCMNVLMRVHSQGVDQRLKCIAKHTWADNPVLKDSDTISIASCESSTSHKPSQARTKNSSLGWNSISCDAKQSYRRGGTVQTTDMFCTESPTSQQTLMSGTASTRSAENSFVEWSFGNAHMYSDIPLPMSKRNVQWDKEN